MKKRFLAALATGLLVVGMGGVAQALPTLQIGIEDGYYDGSTETVMVDSDIFTFYALSDTLDYSPYKIALSLIPNPSLRPDSPAVGDFSVTASTGVGSSTISNWIYGTPDNLPTHDVFPTWYKEIQFAYNGESLAEPYNVEQDPDGWVAWDGANFLYSGAFNVDMSGIESGYSLHIDLYSTDGITTGKNIIFAPFSHDGQGGGDPVPEPATMLLFGTGLAGLAGVTRRRKKA